MNPQGLAARAEAIRDIAERLLTEERVVQVLGYAAGTGGLNARPLFAETPEEAQLLTWGGFCVGNPATLISPATMPTSGVLAVVAQGCVSRNLVGLIRENRVKRERLYIIGVPCLGMLDRRKVEAKFPGKTILSVDDDGATEIVIRGEGFEQTALRRDFYRDNCYTCLHRNPVIYDELVADPVEDKAPGNIDNVAAPWEKLAPVDRLARFQETFKDCIRCYACRDSCPLCYCNTCFVDENKPQWCGKTQDAADVHTFHLLRAFHCAGRCTDCGACESACPQGIKMRRMTSRLEKDVRTLYGYEPWLSLDATPPLTVYRPDDSEDFMKSAASLPNSADDNKNGGRS